MHSLQKIDRTVTPFDTLRTNGWRSGAALGRSP